MLDYLRQNLGTIAVTVVLVISIILIIRILYKDKKAGKSACGCNCAGCPSAGSCHSAAAAGRLAEACHIERAASADEGEDLRCKRSDPPESASHAEDGNIH